MALFKLVAGAEIDLATPEDLHKAMAGLGAKIEKLAPSTPDVIDTPTQIVVDAAGNVGGGLNGTGQVIYRPPVGMFCTITRLAVADNTHTPAAPLTAGWLAFYRAGIVSDGLVTFLPQGGSTAVLPAVIVDSGGAKVLRNGQPLLVIGAGMPATSVIGLSLQITLWRESRPAAAAEAVSD